MNRELAKECLDALEGFVNDMERQSSWIYEEAIKQTKDLIARLRAAIEEPTREEVLEWATNRGYFKYPRIAEECVPSEAPYFVFYPSDDTRRSISLEHAPVVDEAQFQTLLAAYRQSKKEPANE